MTNFHQDHIQANGIDFHYLEIGTGPLVLCLHGFPDNAFTYRYWVLRWPKQDFASSRRSCVAIRRPPARKTNAISPSC